MVGGFHATRGPVLPKDNHHVLQPRASTMKLTNEASNDGETLKGSPKNLTISLPLKVTIEKPPS